MKLTIEITSSDNKATRTEVITGPEEEITAIIKGIKSVLQDDMSYISMGNKGDIILYTQGYLIDKAINFKMEE